MKPKPANLLSLIAFRRSPCDRPTRTPGERLPRVGGWPVAFRILAGLASVFFLWQPDARVQVGSAEWEANEAAMRSTRVLSLPQSIDTPRSELEVVPRLHIETGAEGFEASRASFSYFPRPSANLTGNETPFAYVQETLPPPILTPDSPFPTEIIAAEPVFGSLADEFANTPRFYAAESSEPGLGHERLAFSLFDIDAAQPANQFRARVQIAHGYRVPDRAEYFWAATGGPLGPPLGESAINFQEARLRVEMGSKKFSTSFEVPFRAVDPELNSNHAGLSDMQLAIKTVLLDGNQWMLTQYFGTKFSTGSAKMGLGTGSVALEPGLLFRNRLRESTWLHGEMKFWFPLAGDLNHRGQVLKFATGINHVYWETDSKALIPSLELSTYSILNGLARDSSQQLREVDGDFVLNLTPGIRYAADNRGDFGLFEIGAGWAIPVTTQRLADSLLMIESRWFW